MPVCAPPAATCPGCEAPLGGPVLLRGRDRLMAGPGEFAVLRCAACGLASTYPRIDTSQLADYYPAGYHRRAGGRRAGSGELQTGSHEGEAAGAGVLVPMTGLVERLRLAAIIRLGPYRPLSRRRPGRMLDVGCGNGELARAFARRGWHVAGVEPVASAAAGAAGGGGGGATRTL